jgi:GntR family transcriptional repressor for pyruvate dehydrogenase complex
VNRVSVTRQVVDILYEALRSGRYRSGDRFPSEVELAVSLGVGRSALREAIRELLTLDLLEIRPGRGTFVRPIRPELLAEGTDFHGALNQVIGLELLEVRFALEPEAAALAARRATRDDVHCLGRDVEALGLAIAQGGPRPPEDAGFHVDVVRATHNSALLRLSTAIMQFYEHDYAVPSPTDLEEHRAICEAIVKGMEKEARAAMQKHLRTVSSQNIWSVPGRRSRRSRAASAGGHSKGERA